MRKKVQGNPDFF